MVFKLQKNLYDLKQAPRRWYKKFDMFTDSNGFSRCQADYCCYVTNFGDSFIILLLYVDDVLITCACKFQIDKLKKGVAKELAAKDTAKHVFGVNVYPYPLPGFSLAPARSPSESTTT